MSAEREPLRKARLALAQEQGDWASTWKGRLVIPQVLQENLTACPAGLPELRLSRRIPNRPWKPEQHLLPSHLSSSLTPFSVLLWCRPRSAASWPLPTTPKAALLSNDTQSYDVSPLIYVFINAPREKLIRVIKYDGALCVPRFDPFEDLGPLLQVEFYEELQSESKQGACLRLTHRGHRVGPEPLLLSGL